MSKIKILLLIEVILVLIGIVGAFQQTEVVVGQEYTETLVNEGVSMSAGVYTATIYYDTKEQFLCTYEVKVPENSFYKSLLCNAVTMNAGYNSAECQFYLLNNTDALTINIMPNGSETLEVYGIEITQGAELSRIFLFTVIIVSAIINSMVFVYQYNRKRGLSSSARAVIVGVPVVALIASLPAMVDYNIFGADIVYHLSRIEALKESIVRGELSARLDSMWLAGHGYASSLFYCDTFLIIPALFRIIGFSVNSSYKMYIFCVNFTTAVISYVSFSKCFKDRKIGLLGCVLYTLAPYRICNIYNRSALGEYTAMIFLPLLAWGFYKIYTADSNEKGYLKNCIVPIIGFSGLIQSHILSCEMAGVAVVVLCVILWRKTFQKKIFITLSMVVVITAVINSWFIVPFLDLMASDNYYFGNNADVLIQHRGIYPAHLFYTLQAGGNSSRFVENGMINTEPYTLGAALILGMALWLVVRKKIPKNQIDRQLKMERSAGDTAFLLGCIILFMSTSLFPYDYLSTHSRILAVLIGSLQFPTRFMGISTICIVMCVCLAGKWSLTAKWKVLSGKAILIMLCGISIVFSVYQVNTILLTRDMIRIYTATSMNHSAVLGAEYLPKEASFEHLSQYHDPVASQGVIINYFEKDGLTIKANVSTETDDNLKYLEVPLLFYKGYEAYTVNEGKQLEVVKGDNCDVRVLLENNFSGEIFIVYSGMWYWHVAEVISIIFGISLILYFIGNKFQKRCGNLNKT